jgi:hypothetical protein
VKRWGTEDAAAIAPLEIERWLKRLRKEVGLANPTLHKICQVMSLVYKHSQRWGLYRGMRAPTLCGSCGVRVPAITNR